MSKSKKDSNYEWLGEDDELTGEKDIIAKELMGEEYSKSYFPPIRVYDNKVKADKYLEIAKNLANKQGDVVTFQNANDLLVNTE